jgi:hypothetical protein
MAAVIHQCDPVIYGFCSLGRCAVHFVIDYGVNLNPVFVVDLYEKNRQCISIDSGEFWFGENEMYNMQKPEVPKERIV